MDSQQTFEPSTQETLEDMLSMLSRQTRLLEEIRDLLAAAPKPRRRSPGNDHRSSRDYD